MTTRNVKRKEAKIEATGHLPPWVLIVSVSSGLVFLAVILVIALSFPDPNPFQFFVFRVVLALAAAAFGATISGFLRVELPLWGRGVISAGGALALFVLVYNVNPPEMILEKPVPTESHQNRGSGENETSGKPEEENGEPAENGPDKKSGENEIASKKVEEREDVKIFRDRAETIRYQLTPYIDLPEVKPIFKRFLRLHEEHIQACANNETIRAHDLAKEIYSLLYQLERKDFWPREKEKPILARLYSSGLEENVGKDEKAPESPTAPPGDIPETTTVSWPGAESPNTAIRNTLEMEFRYIPPGTFMMGSPDGETGRYTDETLHRVTLTDGFYMQTTEVTQKQWKAVMGSNPSHFKDCDDCPVESVTWNDAMEFIGKLNRMENESYRLPTEAEWEYACRAGTTTRYYTGDTEADLDRAGWYSVNSEGKTHPVGGKAPNDFGLYDMHGNVWEWCQDWYGEYPTSAVTDPLGPESGSGRVSRGGSWILSARRCRAARRVGWLLGGRDRNLGFRLCLPRSAPGTGKPGR